MQRLVALITSTHYGGRSMWKFCLSLGLMFGPFCLNAADLRPLISREAGKYAAAWQRSDVNSIVSYLPPNVIQQQGGRAAVTDMLKDQFAQARSFGVDRLDAVPGQPTPPKLLGRWLASVLPATAVLHSAHLNLTQQTHVLALSADQGKKWFFILLYEITQAELISWFPEFRGKIIVPKPPAPQLKIVY